VRILLGVSAGIAAYKAALLLRLLTEQGHDVRVVPTRASLEFVGRATWEALSGHAVTTGVFDDVPAVEHVSLGKSAELMIVAPATADLLARAAAGRCDDLLTAAMLTVRCPVLLAPAMHTEMWQHPATVANVATLRSRGVHVLDPDSGRLTGVDTGPGRLPEPAAIAAAALALVSGSAGDADRARDLAGRSVVVSAGGTREPLDPVRFLGNRSTGRQGVALARAARDRGAAVTLIAANLEVGAPDGVEVVRVETTAQLRSAVRQAATEADVVVMAAAVADFRPASTAAGKIKKTGSAPAPIALVLNPDVLAELATDRLRTGQVVVGFAAETGSDEQVLEHGRDKARRKGADLLVLNRVGAGVGFAVAHNEVTLLDHDGVVVGHAGGSKDDVAHGVWDAVATLLDASRVRHPVVGSG